MKNSLLNILLLSWILLVFSCSISSAQTVAGKIFLKEDAEALFGPVYQSVKMPVSDLENLLSKSGDYLMLRFENSDLYILDAKRNVIFSTSSIKVFSATDIMKYYSNSVIKELLSKGQNTYVTIEKRENVVSVTDGAYTMEEAQQCPPICPW